MNITFTIPDNKANEVVDAICGTYHYQAKILDAEGLEIDNPQTKAQFAKEQIVKFIKDIHRAYVVSQAVEAAEAATKPVVDIT